MATAQNSVEMMREIEQTLGRVPLWIKEMPEVAAGPFWAMMRDFHLAETKIPNKYKELIGLAVSGATRCKYCVLFHTEAARLFGATDDEIREANMMSAHTMSASTFLNGSAVDFEQFRAETRAIVAYVRQQQTQPAPRTGTQPRDQAASV